MTSHPLSGLDHGLYFDPVGDNLDSIMQDSFGAGIAAIKTPDREAARLVLSETLGKRIKPEAMAWLQKQAQSLMEGAHENVLFVAFSQAVRHAGKAALAPTAEELAAAQAADPDWDLAPWTCDVAARAYLMASLPDEASTPERLLKVHQTADMGEHIALVKALFLAPRCGEALHIAREGIRSNMRTVFEAITARNPYPARYFDELAFNQMVVKCLFVDLPLRDITGLDSRLNATLRQILVDLAHERWAAGRVVSPEMWRCVGPFADAAGRAGMLKALEAGLASPQGENSPDARGAALGMMKDPSGESQSLLNPILKQRAPALAEALRNGRLTWNNYDHA